MRHAVKEASSIVGVGGSVGGGGTVVGCDSVGTAGPSSSVVVVVGLRSGPDDGQLGAPGAVRRREVPCCVDSRQRARNIRPANAFDGQRRGRDRRGMADV